MVTLKMLYGIVVFQVHGGSFRGAFYAPIVPSFVGLQHDASKSIRKCS